MLLLKLQHLQLRIYIAKACVYHAKKNGSDSAGETKLYMAHQTAGNSSVTHLPGENSNVNIQLCVSFKIRMCKLYTYWHLCGIK